MHGIVNGELNKLSQIGLDFTSDWLKLWHDLIFRGIHSCSAVIFLEMTKNLAKQVSSILPHAGIKRNDFFRVETRHD